MATLEGVLILCSLFAVGSASTCYYSYYSYIYKSTRYTYSTYCDSYYSYCCGSTCCYYSYENVGGTIAGIVIGCLVGIGLLVSLIVAVCCICRKRQMYAGRVMSPQPTQATVSVVQTSTPGPMVQYPAPYPVQPNYAMGPPSYAAAMQTTGTTTTPGQPAAGQTPYGQPVATGQTPYGQPVAAGQTPYGQPKTTGQTPYGQPSATGPENTYEKLQTTGTYGGVYDQPSAPAATESVYSTPYETGQANMAFSP